MQCLSLSLFLSLSLSLSLSHTHTDTHRHTHTDSENYFVTCVHNTRIGKRLFSSLKGHREAQNTKYTITSHISKTFGSQQSQPSFMGLQQPHPHSLQKRNCLRPSVVSQGILSYGKSLNWEPVVAAVVEMFPRDS
jgi:hypothetical protein